MEIFLVKDSEKTCTEDHQLDETRTIIQAFNKKFNLFVVFSIFYGLIFLNYIDIIIPGGVYGGYHLWLSIMYFFPFVALTIFFPKNWRLSIGLGLLASLMNDVFYGVVRNLISGPYDLIRYYTLWLIPGNENLFQLNLGFIVIPVFSWMMAISIYARIIVVPFLLKTWKDQAKIRCLKEASTKKKGQRFWSDIYSRLRNRASALVRTKKT